MGRQGTPLRLRRGPGPPGGRVTGGIGAAGHRVTAAAAQSGGGARLAPDPSSGSGSESESGLASTTSGPGSSAGSHIKLYDWIDGAPADVSDPEILDWFGRTMALPHRAGEGETAMPSAWYERCPGDDEWAALHAEVRRAGMPWADELGRFIATSARELAHWVTPSDSGGLVTSHLDLQPQNVLVGRAGPVLLDWDNAGSASTERELARALFVWSGGNEGDVEAGVRVARAYRSAGGRAVVQGPQSFSMLFATELNYVRVQAECAIDPTVTAAQREFGQRTEGGAGRGGTGR